MSLLQETRNQYASFSGKVSCVDIVTTSVSTNALTAAAIMSPAMQSTAVVTEAFQMTTAPAAGSVLTSDASGNASWQPAAGGGGSLAYGYAVGQDTTTIAAGSQIRFDLGTVVHNAGFIDVPGLGGTSFIISTAGVYEYSFYVAAQTAAATTVALEIALIVNVLGGVPQNTFRSGLGGADTDPLVCVGSGLITLAAADFVSLQNITNSSGTAIDFTTAPAGGVAGANRTLTLKLIA